MEEDEQNIPYIRVGTTYYKIIEQPQISGDRITTLSKWSKDTIVQDQNRRYLDKIPKYDGFCCIPNNLDYQKNIGKFYNIYNEIPKTPALRPVATDHIPYTFSFIRHIFHEQLDLGLDYLKLLLEKPTQMLPILCLVSKERATGKSTFIKWLKEIFSLNMTYIKGDTFSSQFNSDWATMLLIAIDEVFFDKKEITERLKYLSTTNKDKLENKGKDRVEIDFFGKFILCSNNENNFIQIDESEIRFWVRKIEPLKQEDTQFLEKLKDEIPLFLRFLIDRKFFTPQKTRMWFAAEQIRTKALEKLFFKNNSRLEAKMIESLYEFFEATEEKDIQIVPQDILNFISRMYKIHYFTRNEVRKVLKDKWELEPQQSTLAYIRYDIDLSGIFYENNSKGRYFTISKDLILQKFDDLMT